MNCLLHFALRNNPRNNQPKVILPGTLPSVIVRPLGPLPWSLTGIYSIPPLLTPVKPASISPSESRGTERAISDPGAHWTVNSLTALSGLEHERHPVHVSAGQDDITTVLVTALYGGVF